MINYVELRSKLEDSIDVELEDRVVAHRAEIAALEAARTSADNFEARIDNRPLVLLSQGDSWFDYPLIGNGPMLGNTDVIAQLRRMGAMPPKILNLAVAGDTAVSIMSLKRQSKMINELRNKSNWIDGKPDAILFSAGGNDIAGDEFCIFLDFNDGRSAGLNEKRFLGALGMVQACYLQMFAIRDRIVPGVPIFGHCYDFPIPNGVHPACAGPWLRPSLDYCNWSVAQGTSIVREALLAFRTMLLSLAADRANNFHLIETQGALRAQDWANELHPFEHAFKTIARRFAIALDTTIRATFTNVGSKGRNTSPVKATVKK